MQEASIKAVERFDQLREIKWFRSWFVRMALNTYLNRKRQDRDIPFEKVNAVELRTPESIVGTKLAMDIIVRYSKYLPRREKQAFTMHYIEGIKFRDLAEIMNCTYECAKSTSYHAIDRISAMIDQGLP